MHHTSLYIIAQCFLLSNIPLCQTHFSGNSRHLYCHKLNFILHCQKRSVYPINFSIFNQYESELYQTNHEVTENIYNYINDNSWTMHNLEISTLYFWNSGQKTHNMELANMHKYSMLSVQSHIC